MSSLSRWLLNGWDRDLRPRVHDCESRGMDPSEALFIARLESALVLGSMLILALLGDRRSWLETVGMMAVAVVITMVLYHAVLLLFFLRRRRLDKYSVLMGRPPRTSEQAGSTSAPRSAGTNDHAHSPNEGREEPESGGSHLRP